MSQELMDETLTIINEDGVEKEMVILFTFTSDENNKAYVFYYDAQEPGGDVYVSSYTDEGQLFPVEDDEEWEMIQEVFNTFMTEDESEDDHHHHHHHHHDCDCEKDDPNCDCHEKETN